MQSPDGVRLPKGFQPPAQYSEPPVGLRSRRLTALALAPPDCSLSNFAFENEA